MCSPNSDPRALWALPCPPVSKLKVHYPLMDTSSPPFHLLPSPYYILWLHSIKPKDNNLSFRNNRVVRDNYWLDDIEINKWLYPRKCVVCCRCCVLSCEYVCVYVRDRKKDIQKKGDQERKNVRLRLSLAKSSSRCRT